MTKRILCAMAAVLLLGVIHAGAVRDGERIDLDLETPHPYGLTDAAEPTLAWSETVHQPGATYIQVHFQRFQLAEDDFVIVRSPDGAQSWRYEGLGRAGLGLHPRGFWSSRIWGSTAVVELHTRHAEGDYGFTMDGFYRGLTELEIAEANPELPLEPGAICGTDDAEWAKCYMDSEPVIYDRARAVSRLHLPGSSCTGWLVGCEGHLMTNNHCIGSQWEADNTDYEFMGEGATCQTPCFSSMACPGPIEATNGTLVRTNSALDYSLVLLPTNVSDTYGYLQLRESGAVIDERIYIPQHPAGWGKRIAVFSDNASDASGFCEIFSLNRPPCSGGPGDIGYYCDTQGGSSGSPVLAYDDHRVVSLHHCANCPNRGLDISDVIGSIGTDLPNCTLEQLAGTIALDREIYTCADTILITVVDDSLQGADTQLVTLRSSTEPVAEPIMLAEDTPGVFVGSVSTTSDPATAHDGRLSLSHGDAITAEYIDADDGSGGTNISRFATADSDCAAPVVSDLVVHGVTMSSVEIDWVTDEPSEGSVRYGTDPPGDSTVEDPGMTLSHGVSIVRLDLCTEYVFSITSTDALGNTGTDDNGGQYHTFMTVCYPPAPIPDGREGTTQMIVERVAPVDGELLVHWDDQCSPYEANLIYGPLDQLSSYAVTGSVCSVAQPATWAAPPAGNIWFLMVGESGDHYESSWGASSSGERSGLTASGHCGVITKYLLGSCP